MQNLPPFLCEENENDQSCKTDESLLKKIIEKAPCLRWIDVLWNRSEKEVLAFLKSNPRLSEDYYFHCNKLLPITLTGICSCVQEAELLIPAFSEGTILQRLLVNLYVGACPHVLLLFSSESTIVNDQFLKRKITWQKSWLDISALTLIRNEFLRISSLPTNRPIGISGGCLLTCAAILNKPTVLKYILECDPQPVGCSWTTFYTNIPFIYFVIEKRYDHILRIIRDIMNGLNVNLLSIGINHPFQSYYIMWEILYDVQLYPLLFCGRFDFHVFEGILETMEKFVTKTTLINFLQLSLWFCFSNGEKDLIPYLMKKKTAVLKSIDQLQFLSSGRKLVNKSDFYHRSEKFCLLGELEHLKNRWKVEEKVLEFNDTELLGLYLQCFSDDSHLCQLFERAVFTGNEQQVAMIIDQHGSTIRHLAKGCHMRPVTLAVMRRSVPMLQLLLTNNIREFTDPLHALRKNNTDRTVRINIIRNSVFTWAHLLEFYECIPLLLSHEPNAKFTIQTNPITECIQAFGSLHGIGNIVKSLASSFDQCVNAPNMEGKTPIQIAIEKDKVELVQTLLLFGADPFSDLCLLNRHGSFLLLIDIIYANIDCADKLDIILSADWHEESIYRELFLDFILNTACLLTRKDKNYLSGEFLEIEDEEDPIVRQMKQKVEVKILRFLRTPKSLMRCCRDVLRIKLKNRNIFRFVEMTKVPNKIQRYLLLENEVEMYKTPFFFVANENIFRLKSFI